MNSKSSWHHPGFWRAGRHHWEGELRSTMAPRVSFRDVTLREGESTPGVHFTLEQRLEIARLLADSGVQELEMPRDSGDGGNETASTVKVLAEAGIREIIRWVGHQFRLPYPAGYDPRRTIDRLIATGVDAIGLLYPYPPAEALPGQSGMSTEESISAAVAAIAYARSQGARVSFGASWATSTSLETVLQFAKAAAAAGVYRFHLFDTAGANLPSAMTFLVRRVKQAVGEQVSVTVHCHNDLGLATGNALAAVEGGADWVDCSAGGIGGRSGNTNMLEVAALLAMYGVETGLRLDRLAALTDYVAACAGLPQNPLAPLVGELIWTSEPKGEMGSAYRRSIAAGLPELVMTLNPALLGRRFQEVYTAHSIGEAAVAEALAEVGQPADPDAVSRVLAAAHQRLSARPLLSKEELLELASR